MSVPAAYVGVILVWATTPLAIQWSSEGVGFLFGVSSRMLLGALVALMLVRLLGVDMPWHRQARRTYLLAGATIYLSMLSVYWGAQYIPSGWISVVFGISPIVTGVLAALWLGERALTVPRILGMALGLGGLAVIFGRSHSAGGLSILGIAAVALAAFIHSAGAVWLKRLNANLPSLSVVSGGLAVAVPLFLATWLAVDGHLPEAVGGRALLAILYLGIIGSVVGFVLYYYALKHLEASRMALLTLVTPVCALLLGHALNGETLGLSVWLGTGLILAGLACFEGLPRRRPA